MTTQEKIQTVDEAINKIFENTYPYETKLYLDKEDTDMCEITLWPGQTFECDKEIIDSLLKNKRIKFYIDFESDISIDYKVKSIPEF